VIQSTSVLLYESYGHLGTYARLLAVSMDQALTQAPLSDCSYIVLSSFDWDLERSTLTDVEQTTQDERPSPEQHSPIHRLQSDRGGIWPERKDEDNSRPHHGCDIDCQSEATYVPPAHLQLLLGPFLPREQRNGKQI
jgi:hypothetical protein